MEQRGETQVQVQQPHDQSPRQPPPPSQTPPAAATARSAAFHDLLLAYRSAANETVEDLAAVVGVSAKALRTYERPPAHGSARTPPTDVFRRLCAHFRECGVLPPSAYAAFAAARAARRRRRHGAIPSAQVTAAWGPMRSPRSVAPRRLTALVGRDELVADVCALLQGTQRERPEGADGERPEGADGERTEGVDADVDGALVTLVGPGGIGKTHLALEVASRLRAASCYSHGIWVVDVTPVAAPEAVAAAMAAQLGLREPVTLPPRERLLAWLADKQVLLVLDNFEHVLAAAPLVSDLLAHSAGLCVLVTSRVPLHLHGEQERKVPPLDAPAASRLFVRRVRDTVPDFARTPENGAAIDAICARLDGLPLALELAARQLRRYQTPDALLDALAPALPQLVDGPRDAPARQQTMRDAIAWSYDLLPPEAQTLLRRLSLCRGGSTPTAARTLGQDLPDVDAALAALLDQGLVQRATGAKDARLSLFEVVREFGLERLDALGAEARREAARRHAAYYLALAEEAETYYQTPEQARWDRVLERDHANLSAALDGALEAGDGEVALRLVVAQWRHWERTGQAAEARHWVDAALLLARNVPAALRARGLLAMSHLLMLENDFETAGRVHDECQALVERGGDRALLGDVFNSCGGLAYRQGDYGRALSLHQDALTIFETLNSVAGMAESHMNLAIAALLQWQPDDAEAHYAQAGALVREMGDRRGEALALFGLGVARTMRADWAGARDAYRPALGLVRRLRDVDVLIYVVHGIAAVAGLSGDPERSAYLFGAGARLCADHAVDLPPSFRALVETTLGMVRDEMSTAEAFDGWYADGQALTVDETLDLARRCVPETQTRATSAVLEE